MRKTIFSLIVFIVIITNYLPAYSQKTINKSTIQQVKSIVLKEMKNQQIPGLSVAILVDNKIAWSEGFGFADIENNVKATAATQYRSASIAKSFIAVAIMQLVEKGLIDLDKPINEYCPEYGKKKWEITTRQLLTHQSGIRSYKLVNGKEDSTELNNTRHYSGVIETLDQFKNDSLLFKPGTDFHYTTYGYLVLCCIIEHVSGIKFTKYMANNVFKPSDMAHTFEEHPQQIVKNRARGYVLDLNRELKNSQFVDMSNKMGYLTTVTDLVSFASSVISNKLINPKTKESMFVMPVLPGKDTLDYGFGWIVHTKSKEFYNLKEVLHGGGTPQVSGLLYILPDEKFAVAFIANQEEMKDRVKLAQDIARIILILK